MITLATPRGLASRAVPRTRPVHNETLGAYVVALRAGKAWTQKEAADHARRRGLTALSRQVLLRLERGQIKNPEPAVLRAVAGLYGVSYDELVNRFVRERFRVDADRTGDQQSGADPPGASHDPAAARLRRTFSTGLGDLGIEDGVIDRLLNHAAATISRKHYNHAKYLPEKQVALAAWDRELARILTNKPKTSRVLVMPSR